MDAVMNRSDWSDVEIQATVEAYFRMLLSEQNGQALNNAHENRVLREGDLAGRTKGSIEFRMQNISTIFEQLGLRRIIGYKPAKNVGTIVSNRIREAVSRLDNLHILASTPEWLENQKNSILYNYLISNSPETIRDIKDVTLESGNLELYRDIQHEGAVNQPDLEKEIIDAIKTGKNLNDLPKDTYRYLSKLAFIWNILEKLTIIITLATFIPTLQTSIEALKTPKEIRTKINTLPQEQRALISGVSIVTKDDVILRANPSKGSVELTRLMKGTWVENLEGDTSEWVHISVDVDGKNIEGWVFRSYLVRL